MVPAEVSCRGEIVVNRERLRARIADHFAKTGRKTLRLWEIDSLIMQEQSFHHMVTTVYVTPKAMWAGIASGNPHCTRCGFKAQVGHLTPYCPECGAQMKEEIK